MFYFYFYLILLQSSSCHRQSTVLVNIIFNFISISDILGKYSGKYVNIVDRHAHRHHFEIIKIYLQTTLKIKKNNKNKKK